MATVWCLRHHRNSAGKELSQTSVSRRHRTKSNQELERQASGTLSHNPKGTSSGWGSQATWKCGNPPGDMGNGTIQQQADGSEPSEPRDEKDRTQVHWLIIQRWLAQDAEARTHATAASIQVKTATVRCLRHRRDSAGKELSHTAANWRPITKTTEGWDRQATGRLCHNPKVTSAG